MIIRLEDITVYGPTAQRNGWRWGAWRGSRHGDRSSDPGGGPSLQQISCAFTTGITAIVGPNGAGKSVLLQVLCGLISQDAGQITLNGRTATRSALRQAMGYLPQAFGFYPQWTARETLHYIALLRGMARQKERERRVAEVLQRTALAAVADRKVGTYSRGMRQAVGIAQVLLGGAPALILDEPAAGLDPEARNKLRRILVEIGQERPIIWASSLIGDTVFADRVLILTRGESCFWGTPVELAAAARPPVTHSLPAPTKGAGTDGAYGAELLEQGYRAILSRGVSS